MADTIKATSTLSIGVDNSNNKTTYIKLPNPETNLTESQIREATGYAISNGVFIDNYDGNVITDTSRINTAYTDFSTVNNLDIGVS